LKWKEDKRAQKEKKDDEDRKKRETAIKSGKQMRSGREMFLFDPSLFVDEDDVIDTEKLEPEENDIDGPIRMIDASGTSISMNIIENNKEDEEEGDESQTKSENGDGNKVEVDENLFQDDLEEDLHE